MVSTIYEKGLISEELRIESKRCSKRLGFFENLNLIGKRSLKSNEGTEKGSLVSWAELDLFLLI
jgi:hypothetical protein